MEARRNERGQLLPGQRSINPSGRPPVAEAVRREVNAILQGAVPGAARKLAELVNHRDPKIALAASEIIMSRVFGKPVQQVDAKVETTNVQQAHLQILLELQAKRDQARQAIDAIDVTPAPPPVPADPAPDAGSPAGGDTAAGGEIKSALAVWRRRKGKVQLAADAESPDAQ